jgi:hypothetical protein
MIANKIEMIIKKTISKADKQELHECCFSKLLSMGELVDRLTIVNIKLYGLKNDVIRNKKDKRFLSAAALTDVWLVEERARLKKCIDEKLLMYIKNAKGFNPEVKNYK